MLVSTFNKKEKKKQIVAALSACLVPVLIDKRFLSQHYSRKNNYKGRPIGTKTIHRKRRSVESIFSELSEYSLR
jgi:hypothetical protein